MREVKPQAIVNAAASIAVDKSELEPEFALRISSTAPEILVEKAKRLGALLVYYSAEYMFAGEERTPYVEDDSQIPINVYGKRGS